MLYRFYHKTVKHNRNFKAEKLPWCSNIAYFAPSCRKVAVNYSFGALIFIDQNKQMWLFIAEVCAWSKSCAMQLSRYKNRNLLYQGKEIFFDFFWHIWSNCIELARKRQVCKACSQSCLMLKYNMILIDQTTSHC